VTKAACVTLQSKTFPWCVPWAESRGTHHPPLPPGHKAGNTLTSPTAIEARHLIGLAERMGIPTGAAIRQVQQLIADSDLERDRSSETSRTRSGAEVSQTVLTEGEYRLA
jgi:hypothetical protein